MPCGTEGGFGTIFGEFVNEFIRGTKGMSNVERPISNVEVGGREGWEDEGSGFESRVPTERNVTAQGLPCE